MTPTSADDLVRLAVQLQLVTPQQVDDCLAQFGMNHSDAEDLLQLMERRMLLTSYQVTQIRKGETDTLVLGGYKLLYRNASGSFARVFRAESVRNGRMVGLKLLRQRWAKDAKIVSQFHREAELCKRLRHKNIVPIYEVGRQQDYHFFTMEFVEGGNLRDFITIRKKLSPEEALRCALDMAEGLEYALRAGITHRDLKLTNVLMSTEGVAKLVDFGLAGDEGISGTVGGEASQRALEYAALEKGTAAPDNDPRSDLFFLGAIFYELLTGVPPYQRTRDRQERKRLGRYANVRPLGTVDPTLPPAVVDIAERLMALNPAERYQSPGEVVEDLRTTLAELAPEANGSADRDELPPTVLCIEDRKKQQDILRTYLTKHGFRVLLLTDVKRALQRLETNPPDCVVLMGESIGSAAPAAYQQLVNLSRRMPMSGVLVLSRRQKAFLDDCRETGTTRVLIQPLTMRDLRQEIQNVLRRRDKDVKPIVAEDVGDDGADDSAVARI